MNAVIRLRGYITEDGKLAIELPAQTEPAWVERQRRKLRKRLDLKHFQVLLGHLAQKPY